MTKNELGKAIYETSHITGEFLLRSGTISNEYFDKYQFEANPQLLAEIAEKLSELIPDDFDYLAGLEVGGIPIATALSMKINKPVVFVRRSAKKYGTCKLAEGPDIAGRKLLVIEDVVTSGGQVVISANDLRNAGAIITRAICVIDRESGGREALKENDIELISLFTMTELKNT
jgi:orotate phosphoribosyltransferase